jgi:hypothetical protein
MPLLIKFLIAGVVVFGAFVVVKAIVSGLSAARRPAHSDQRSSTSPISPEAQIPPPSG